MQRSKPASAPLGALSRFTQRQTRQSEERCELCSAILAEEHRHLVDLSQQALRCACDACAILFSGERGQAGKYLLVPRRYLALHDFQMTDEQWDELMIPVNMVYIFHSTVAGRYMAFYPSPGGAMQSLLSLESWSTLASNNPILLQVQPDVEALLINRLESQRDYYLVPIDACYQLVGLVRVHWKGLHGGDEVWNRLHTFFANLQARSQVVVGGGTDA